MLVWCVSPGLLPPFFLPSYDSSSCANACMDLWWTCCFVAVKDNKDASRGVWLANTGPVTLLSSPTRHLRVGLRVHPSGLVRRSSLSTVRDGESHERQHPTVLQWPFPCPQSADQTSTRVRNDRTHRACTFPARRPRADLLTLDSPPSTTIAGQTLPPTALLSIDVQPPRPTSPVDRPAVTATAAHSCSAVVAHSSLHSTTHTERSLADPPSRGGAMQRARQPLRQRR